MIPIHKRDGRTEWVRPDAVARITDAGTSSQWHGVNCYVKLFDGTTLECSDTAEYVRGLIEKEKR